MALLTIQDLALGYDGHVIVDRLNYHVTTGDYLCIVGENGSGKTTLMKALLHLQEPISGQIVMGDGLKRNRVSSSDDSRTERFPCLCKRNCFVWISRQVRVKTVLQPGRKADCR